MHQKLPSEINQWPQFQGSPLDKLGLRERALAFAPAFLKANEQIWDGLRTKMFSLFPASIDLSQGRFECLIGNLHYVDRLAFDILGGDPKRNWFFDPLIKESIERIGACYPDDSAAQVVSDVVCGLLKKRSKEYATLDRCPMPNEHGGYAISHSFSYKLSEYVIGTGNVDICLYFEASWIDFFVNGFKIYQLLK
ncbi:MAG: hypothetical protein ACJ8FY_24945 [Gemmataceae bacterium]